MSNDNSIFNKSSNNSKNKNPLKLSHSKLKKDNEEIKKKLNSSYTENYISINNNFLNNNEKYLYRVPAKTKPKELILLNEVLQKQIIEVRLQLYDANKRIEDDSNIIKNLKIENNNLLEEKNCYENKLNELTEIYNYDKNYNLNEMESQNKIIAQMDMEISQLNNVIKEKDELIQSLKEQINLMFLNKFENNNDKSTNDNGNINSNISNNNVNNNKANKYSNYSITKLGTFKNYKIKTDINSLKEEFEQLINNKNISQNIKYKEDNYNGKTEGNKNNNFSLLESKEFNEINNLRKAKENANQPNTNKDNINNKMKALIKENKKINDLYNKLKIEYDNLTNNMSDDFMKIKEENISLQKKLNEQKRVIEQLNKTNNDAKVKILEYETEKQQNKIGKLKLEKEITSLNEDKNNLSKLNKQISEINTELTLNNKELVKENNENLSQIKELKNIIDKNSKTNLSNLGNQNENELNQKIKSLEDNKLNLEKKIIEYENIIKELKEKKEVSDMDQKFKENSKKIINENEQLKNEIITLKEQIIKLKNDIDNNATINIANKLKEAEDKIDSMKKENEKNLNELNVQKKKNQELIEEINNYKKNNIHNSLDIEGDEEEEEEYENHVSSDSKVGRKPKNKKTAILELKNIISEKENEIDKFKKINELLTKDNSIKEEKIKKLMNNLEVSQEQSYIKIIETLKQQIKENENRINDLTIKNKELNDLFNNNNIPNSNKYINKKKNKFEKAKLELRDDIENNNNYHSENRVDNSRLSRISGITSTSVGLTDQEKIDKYKKKMKEYKKEIELHLNQINILKEEIRKLNHRLNSPIFQNYDEFINLFQIAFLDYKPNKKEQTEAYEQLNKKFGLFNISNF